MIMKSKKYMKEIGLLLLGFSGLVTGITEDVEAKETPNAPQVTVMNYHHFGYEGEYPRVDNIRVEPEMFKKQLQALKDEGYTTITQEELSDYLHGTGTIPEKSLLITIDDGFESVYEYAYPILEEMDMTAVLFPIISEIEDGERFGVPMMSWEEIKEVVETGVMEVGNHTYDLHYRGNGYKAGYEAMIWNYDENGKRLTIPQQRNRIKQDLLKAERIYKENTGLEMSKAISYPFGAYNLLTLNIAKDLGYELGYTTKSGYSTYGSTAPNESSLEIPRVDISSSRNADFLVNTLENHSKEANATEKTQMNYCSI